MNWKQYLITLLEMNVNKPKGNKMTNGWKTKTVPLARIMKHGKIDSIQYQRIKKSKNFISEQWVWDCEEQLYINQKYLK